MTATVDVPRAAAFEHRIAALVCDPAQPEMADRLPKGPAARLAAPVVRLQMRRNPRRREFFGARMATHGLTDVGAYFAELRRYSMLSLADRITCPTLVVEAEGDFAGGSGAQLIEAMIAPTELVRLTALPRCARSAQTGFNTVRRRCAIGSLASSLTAAQGADGHCGGLGQQVWAGAVYPWLHGVAGPVLIRQRRPAARVCSKIRFVSVERHGRVAVEVLGHEVAQVARAADGDVQQVVVRPPPRSRRRAPRAAR